MAHIDRSTPPHVIRAFRERWGLTQQDLGAALGVGKNRLSGYETGVGAPAWVRYALVGYGAVVLGVPLDALADLTPDLPLPARPRRTAAPGDPAPTPDPVPPDPAARRPNRRPRRR